MQCGKFEIEPIVFGYFRLDGGAMFGSVPKNLWHQKIASDQFNTIQLATRSLIIKDDSRTFLIDVGMGEKWLEKERTIFGIKNFSFAELSFDPKNITDVILTHLHFDHAGGISKFKDGTLEVEPVFPHAAIYIQEDNLTNGRSPNLREKASYRIENVGVLDTARLVITHGTEEIYPNITVHQVNGHTRGLQWIEITGGAQPIFFASDLIPTSHHLPIPYVMGYDMCAEASLLEKQKFLERAVKEKAIVVFEHDPDISAATVTVDARGHYCIDEIITL